MPVAKQPTASRKKGRFRNEKKKKENHPRSWTEIPADRQEKEKIESAASLLALFMRNEWLK